MSDSVDDIRSPFARTPLGARQTHWIDAGDAPDGTPIRLPVLVARGRRPGPTMVVLGGVHGDEYEGIDAVRQLFADLDPAEMAGAFVGAPVCNPPAFAAHSRTSPIDGLNLARVFPGRPDGSASERIAHAITTRVLDDADFLIDLHSSGSLMSMPLLVGYNLADDEAGRLSQRAARCFGVPVIWGHDGTSPGRSLSGPHERGVPWLYTESPSGGWLHAEVARIYAEGVRNVMRLLAILPEPVTEPAHARELSGRGDVDRSITAPAAGFLSNHIEPLDEVAAGDLLGTIRDLAGEPIAEIRAPESGTLVVRRESASVQAGDLLYLLT
ncbi:MAG: succinylglutamate desuccinylase/aspartoacylase family protein [Thermomicrobiales bacterium]|nr:succinylglutamate desuccinylase/aspartoacylase family protein [Thermomicrobiales bacterium]